MTHEERDAEIEAVLDEMYASMNKLFNLTNDRFGEPLTGCIEDGFTQFVDLCDERRENEDARYRV